MVRRQQTPPIEGPLTYDSLRAWMVADLARRLRCAPSEIDTTKPFDALGLDSRNAVQISGALRKVVGRQLSPADRLPCSRTYECERGHGEVCPRRECVTCPDHEPDA